ncbi:Zinc finger protein 778, partial [Schistosoma japonicum]
LSVDFSSESSKFDFDLFSIPIVFNLSVTVWICDQSNTAKTQYYPISMNSFNDQACALCGKVVSTKHGMARHLKIVHEGLEECKCDSCGRKFTTKFALHRHIRKVHEGISELVLPCACCGKKFSAKHGLERHMRLIHESAELCICPLCNRSFSTKFAFNRHTKTVHSDSITLCSPCNMLFPSKFALLEHNLTVHNSKCFIFKSFNFSASKVFACHECLKCFPDTESRRNHEQNDHAVGTSNMYSSTTQSS